MPKSKQRKNHRQKSQTRKVKVEQEKRKLEKSQREMIMKLIEQEKEKGLFENLPQINPTPMNNDPEINIQGPTI